MIPKIIHYIWLGRGPKSQKIIDCINSWKQQMPDYEIKEWNEDNFDINYNAFTKQSYDAKKYAFTSDVIRLYALYTEGGIYMDTDVFCYKPLDEFLNEEAFSGFEEKHYPVTATMGAEKGNPIIKLMLDYYDCIDFKQYDVWTDYIKYEETNTCIMSNILAMLGIDRDNDTTQRIKHFTIYPTTYFFTQNEGWTWHSYTGSWRRMTFKEIEFCMQRKCKVCDKYTNCDLKYKDKEILTYRPFENLKEILEKKINGNTTPKRNIH